MDHTKVRKFSRANIVIPVNIQPVGSSESEAATSVDVSGSGISVVLNDNPSGVRRQAQSFLWQFAIPRLNQPSLAVEIAANLIRWDDWPLSPNQKYKIVFQFDLNQLDHNV